MNKRVIFEAIAAFLLLSNSSIFAGVITGGDLLDQTEATRLETWLGVGDQNWINIWDGVTGDTSTSWHAAVDGVSGTVSIYDVTYFGSNYLIGGYTERDWGPSQDAYIHDETSFIFNLTTGVIMDQSSPVIATDSFSTYASPSYFATFGGGHDLFGGYLTLGSGFANSYTYGTFHATENILGSACLENNIYPYCRDSFTVNGLETYTFADSGAAADSGARAGVISVPTPLALLGLGLAAIGYTRKRIGLK